MAQLPKPTHDYIGLRDCGCCVAVSADMPGWEKDTAKDIAAMIRGGLKVYRIPIEELNKYFPLGCHCKLKEPEQISLFAEVS